MRSLGFIVLIWLTNRTHGTGNSKHNSQRVIFVSESSSNILIPCASDLECDEVVKDSKCSVVLGGYCTCPAGFTFSTNVKSCIKG